jgi:hypothetical protein
MSPVAGPENVSSLTKLAYLAGFKSQAGPGQDWLADKLDNPDLRSLGALLAVPNTLVMGTAGLASLLLGSQAGLIALAMAPLIIVAGAFFAPVTRKRIGFLSRKNGFSVSE